MTCAEKTVQSILDVLNTGGTQQEMIEIVKQAMQAQREADFDAFQKTFHTYNEAVIGNAITRAEVKP